VYVTGRAAIIIRSATTRGEGRGQPKCVVLRGGTAATENVFETPSPLPCHCRDPPRGKPSQATLPVYVVNAIARVRIGIRLLVEPSGSRWSSVSVLKVEKIVLCACPGDGTVLYIYNMVSFGSAYCGLNPERFWVACPVALCET
jgi:hypothetical protein